MTLNPSNSFLIKGGIVISGESPHAVPALADVAIEGDRIKAIGRLSDHYYKKTIDARGLYIVPGFIDVHSHSEFTLLADGRAEGKIAQGITTEINGNCGLSSAPLYGEAIKQREDELNELGINERWNTFEEYFQLLRKRGIAVNFITLAGHGSIRASCAGYEDRPLSSSETVKAINLLREALLTGAKGLSTGLMYPPGCYSDTDEIVEFINIIKEYGGIYTTHMRDEGDRLLESIDEVIDIINRTGVRAHISHLKTNGERNWSKIDDVIERFEFINEDEPVLTCDRYPYTASCTSLDSLLPDWVFEGGKEEELNRLRKDRARVINELVEKHHDWSNIVISSLMTERNRWMQGEKICDISTALNKEPEDCVIDILIEERLEVSAIFFSMNEGNLKKILKLPYTMIGSDSSARCFDGVTAKGKPHPRSFGTFPRMLRKYVREDGILSLAEAIYKMTGLPAKRFGIRERGIIKEGFFADITIFDADRIKDNSDYKEPFSKPDGICYVFVNGIPVIYEEKPTGILPGRVI